MLFYKRKTGDGKVELFTAECVQSSRVAVGSEGEALAELTGPLTLAIWSSFAIGTKCITGCSSETGRQLHWLLSKL